MTAEFIFENVNEIRFFFREKILEILKKIYTKIEYFTILIKKNHLFKIAYQHFEENEFKSLYSDFYDSFLKIPSNENKKSYLLNFYRLNKNYFDYTMEKWISLI